VTEAFDFRGFEELYPAWEARFRVEGPLGSFAYEAGGSLCSYGSTDMVFNRATMGALDLGDAEADAWAAVINSFQDPRTGWYRKRNTMHFREHTTAYAVAALALLGRKPDFPVLAARRVAASPEALGRWLRSVPWSIVWPGSHVAAGLPAILHMTGEGSADFFERYFAWLDERVEPSTGFWSRGIAQRVGLAPKLSRSEMGGAFHMHFVYEARGRAWPLPERVVDACLALQGKNGFWDGGHPYCIDLDGLYCLLRSSALAGGYRKDEAYEACLLFLRGAQPILCSEELLALHYRRSHRLPGALSAVAECALHFPELVRTSVPWVQTLGEACFI
jgi:hypothetical protein